jgi:IS1 family transposase
VTCHNCRADCRRFGKRKGRQRYQCCRCRKLFIEPRNKTLDGMNLPVEKAEAVLRLLLEGNSVSSVERFTEVHHTTILKLLILAGGKAGRIMGDKIRNVPVTDVQADEIWSYIGKKEKRRQPSEDITLGDCYTFVAIDRDTKLVLNVTVGRRDQVTTDILIEGLRLETSGNFQITTDGFAPYRTAIPNTLDDRADFAMLIKVHRATPEGERTYSPAEVVATEVVPVMGRPDPARICTSHVERQNLSMRMGIRRFTRLTNAFSKKFENHAAAIMLWFAFYNFSRVHKTLRITPAMAAGIADHIWTVRELLEAA